MEQTLTDLYGAGALVLSPLLVPGLRPVTKSAIKCGLAIAAASRGVAEATKDTAASTGEKLQDAVTKASTKPAAAAEAPTTAEPAAAEESQASESAAAPAGVAAGISAAMAPLTQSLQPIIQSVVRGGQVLADAATGVVAEASKQWNDLLADAKAEREASEQNSSAHEPSAAEAARSQVTTDAAKVPTTPSETPIASTPADIVTPVIQPETAAAAVADMTAGPDDLRLIKGIGPKTANLLEESGITTFEQLAAMDVWELRDILAKGGPRFRSIDPNPWPGEARRMLKARGSQTQ